jgi:hypothetical protein
LTYRLKWSAHEDEVEPPQFVSELASQKTAVKVAWLP